MWGFHSGPHQLFADLQAAALFDIQHRSDAVILTQKNSRVELV